VITIQPGISPAKAAKVSLLMHPTARDEDMVRSLSGATLPNGRPPRDFAPCAENDAPAGTGRPRLCLAPHETAGITNYHFTPDEDRHNFSHGHRMRQATASRIIVLILTIVLGTPALASQEAPPGASNAISIDVFMPAMQLLFPSSILAGSISGSVSLPIGIDYQRVLDGHHVLAVAVFVRYSDSIGLLGVNPWIELDWRPFDVGLGGFYLGPALSAEFALNAANSFFFGLGGAVGYEFLLPCGFTITATLGLTFGPEFFASSTIFRENPRTEIALGYRFL
jgi:hypothetical protein